MRLFIAVDLAENIKDQLAGMTRELATHAERGVFTRRGNFHITLVFLGETGRVREIERVMDRVRGVPFDVALGGLGRFRRGEGDIYWIGVEAGGELARLQKELNRGLVDAGFRVEAREFTPHLTLGRQLRWEAGFDPRKWAGGLGVMRQTVDRIHLMKSERIEGRLVYTPVYTRVLSL